MNARERIYELRVTIYEFKSQPSCGAENSQMILSVSEGTQAYKPK